MYQAGMALDAKQREQIVKIMGMTGSTNDHEALAHLRRAQKILDTNKMTWLDLLTDNDFMFISTMKSLREAQAEGRRLRDQLAKVTASYDKRLQAVVAELEQMRAERDALRTERDDLSAQVQNLRGDLAALTPEPDPWETELADFIATDRRDRYTAEYLMTEVLGVPDRHVNTDTYRRLGRCMRRIGGWVASNNVPETDGRRVRGYQRPNPFRRKPD